MPLQLSARDGDPWGYLALALPSWRVCLCDLPVLGAVDWTNLTIHLDRTMDAAERRCTLAHEIEHIERGDTGRCPPAVERRIEEHVARRLISLDDLLDALRWGRHPDEIADDLVVDMQILATRIERSTGAERRAIRRALRRRDEAA